MELTTIITSVVSAVLAGGSLIFSLYTYRKALVHDRCQATLDAYNLLQGQVFDELNLMMPADIRAIAQHPTSTEYKRLGSLVARIEHFCVGVNTGIYDRDTVYDLAHGYLDGEMLRNRIEPVIQRKNRNGKDYYENIHCVLDWMKARTEKEEARNAKRSASKK